MDWSIGDNREMFGCYAERVPDYQLDPQYLPKGVNRPVDGSLHILCSC